MNTFWIIAGAFSLVALMAHAIVGDKEYTELRPADGGNTRVNQIFIQTRCGWHWVSVDLLFFSILLFTIGASDLIQAKQEIAFLVSLYFFLCGAVWLVTVFVNRTNDQQMFKLGQWIFCFAMSALVYCGR